MKIWILMRGERYEGGHVLGVFANDELAYGQFAIVARTMHRYFNDSAARRDEDGSLHFESGCDWLSLEPHDVVTQIAIEAAG